MDLLTAAFAVAALIDPGQASGRETVLRSVRVGAEAGTSRVVIETDGPLPSPSVGVLDGPPRIYLDFRGVIPATRGTAAGMDPLVRRVRVAVHQRQPVVTRVVIELTKSAPHQIDAGGRELGRLIVIVGDTSPAASHPTRTSPAPAVPSRVERDRAAAAAALERLERLRSLLSSIDTRSDVAEESLRAGIDEFRTIRQTLALLRPPGVPASTREILMKVCVLGTTAANTRLEVQQRADAVLAWNAASAAAGALILLDRAASELRSASVPK